MSAPLYRNLLTFRYADPAEAQTLAAFAAATFVEAYREQIPVAQLEAYARVNFTADRVREEIVAPLARYFVAEADGAVVGYALAWIESEPDCELDAVKPAQLQRIYVDPAWHGRGVAGELVGRVLSDARQAGCDVVWLAVWDANARAIRFYQKAGFQVVGEQDFVLGTEVQRDFVMAWPPA